MDTNQDFGGLTGPQKAALLILAVGHAQAAKLFARMGDAEIQEVSLALASLDRIGSEMVERMLAAFADEIAGSAR